MNTYDSYKNTNMDADIMAQEAAAMALEESDQDMLDTGDTRANGTGTVVNEIPSVNNQVPNSEMNGVTMSGQSEQTANAQNQVQSALQDTGSMLDHYGMFALQSGLTGLLVGKVTGSKTLGAIAGLAGTKLLQEMELLPDSFSGIGDYINHIKSYFNGEHQASENMADQVAQQTVLDGQKVNALGDSMGTVREVANGLGTEGSVSIADKMRQSGIEMGQTGVFNLTGQMSDSQLSPLQMVSEGNMDVFAQKVNQLADENGQLSDEMKADVLAECKTLYDGFEAYAQGASEQLNQLHGDNPDVLANSEFGLQRVMSCEVQPFYETMKELNEKYQFMSEEDLAYFKGTDNMPGYTAMQQYDDGSLSTSQPDTSVETPQEQAEFSSQSVDKSAVLSRPLPTVNGMSDGNSLGMEME